MITQPFPWEQNGAKTPRHLRRTVPSIFHKFSPTNSATNFFAASLTKSQVGCLAVTRRRERAPFGAKTRSQLSCHRCCKDHFFKKQKFARRDISLLLVPSIDPFFTADMPRPRPFNRGFQIGKVSGYFLPSALRPSVDVAC